jgi:predicted AAA+ superfamily ATPase
MDAYTRAFIERDLPTLGVSVSAPLMRRLWTMLAHLSGGLWNASQLGASLGVSYHTVDRYADILEQAFLVRKLRPYFANLGKRLVKSPKLYFRDTGLLHYFLGIRSREDLDVHPVRGASWEAFIIDQLLSAYDREHREARAWFWRTAQGDEVDLLMETSSGLVPFEIKLHSAPSAADAKGLRRCMTDLHLERGYLVHSGNEQYSLGAGVTAVPARRLLRRPSVVRTL